MRPLLPVFALALLTACSKVPTGPATGAADAHRQDAPAAAGAATDDLSKLSLKELFDRTQTVSARSRQLQAAMQDDIAQTKARLGANLRGPEGVAEDKRIRETWPPQLMAADAEMERIHQEISRRCPGGAMLNATEQQCSER